MNAYELWSEFRDKLDLDHIPELDQADIHMIAVAFWGGVASVAEHLATLPADQLPFKLRLLSKEANKLGMMTVSCIETNGRA